MSDYPDEIAESTRIIGKRPGREETTRQAKRQVDNDPTELMGRTQTIKSRTDATEEPQTQVIGRPTRRGAQGTKLFGQGELPATQEEADALTDPVVGWLVVVDGPGRGNFIAIGYGQNTIGRGQEERVSVNFGDEQISRESHCFIIYEPNEREFTVMRGMGKGLTYLNQKVVLEPRPIRSGELLRIGATTLRFMAFCGPEYDWQDGPLTASKAGSPVAHPATDAPANPGESPT